MALKHWTSSMIFFNFVIIGTSILGLSYHYQKFNPWFGLLPKTVYECFQTKLVVATISVVFLTVLNVRIKQNRSHMCQKSTLIAYHLALFLILLITASVGTAHLNSKMYPYYTGSTYSSSSSSGSYTYNTTQLCIKYWTEMWPEELEIFYQQPSLVSQPSLLSEKMYNVYLAGIKLEK